LTDLLRPFKAIACIGCVSLHTQVMVSDLPLAAGFILSVVLSSIAAWLLLDLTKPPRA
jgi:hypothetical protein